MSQSELEGLIFLLLMAAILGGSIGIPALMGAMHPKKAAELPVKEQDYGYSSPIEPGEDSYGISTYT